MDVKEKFRFKPRTEKHLSRSWARSTYKQSYLGVDLPGTTQPALTNDIVIIGNAQRLIKAFKQKTGAALWEFEVKGGAEALAATDDAVYFGGGDGYFYKLDVDSGRVLWKVNLNSPSTSRPLVRGPFVFHLTQSGAFYALESETGRVLWVKTRPLRSDMTVRGTSNPVFYNGKLFIGRSDGFVSAYNASNGQTLWQKPLEGAGRFSDVDAEAVLSGGCLLIPNFSEALYCLNPESGQTKWVHRFEGSVQRVAVKGDHVYFSAQTQIQKLGLANGKLIESLDYPQTWGAPTTVSFLKEGFVVGFNRGPVAWYKDFKTLYDEFYPGRGVSAAMTLGSEEDVFVFSNQSTLYRLKAKTEPKVY